MRHQIWMIVGTSPFAAGKRLAATTRVAAPALMNQMRMIIVPSPPRLPACVAASGPFREIDELRVALLVAHRVERGAGHLSAPIDQREARVPQQPFDHLRRVVALDVVAS